LLKCRRLKIRIKQASENMPLTFRLTQPADFPQCLEVIHDRFLFNTPASRAELKDFWGKILADRTALSTVVEDGDRPKGRNIVGFCMYVFVTDDFAAKAQTTLPAFLAQQILKGWKKGGSSNPILSRKAIAQHNAREGLNFLILHYGVETKETFELEIPARGGIFEGFQSLYKGFQHKLYLHEVYGSAEKEIMVNAGCRVLRDYAREPNATPLVRDKRPFLTGVVREESLKKLGLTSTIFNYSHPRFGFSTGEQDVLEKAFLGEIDRDIAPALGLTVWAIKKRWQGIYGKVEKEQPSILGPVGNKNDEEYQKTRRRFLLDYLRAHQEELRPYAPEPASPQKTKKP
jgi:hypothetical protein